MGIRAHGRPNRLEASQVVKRVDRQLPRRPRKHGGRYPVAVPSWSLASIMDKSVLRAVPSKEMIWPPMERVTLRFHGISVGSEVRQWNGQVPRSECRRGQVELGIQTSLYDRASHRNREKRLRLHVDRDSHMASALRNGMVQFQVWLKGDRARGHDRRGAWRERWLFLGSCRMGSIDVRSPRLRLLESVKASRDRGSKVNRPKDRPTPKPLVSKLNSWYGKKQQEAAATAATTTTATATTRA